MLQFPSTSPSSSMAQGDLYAANYQKVAINSENATTVNVTHEHLKSHKAWDSGQPASVL